MLNCQRLYNQVTYTIHPKAVSAPTTVLQDAARQRRVALSLNRPWVDAGGRSAGCKGSSAQHHADATGCPPASSVLYLGHDPTFQLEIWIWFSLIQPDFFLLNIYIYYVVSSKLLLHLLVCVCVVVHAYGLKTEPAFCMFFWSLHMI